MLRFAFTLALNGRLPEAREVFLAIEKVHGADAYRLARRALRERISEGEQGLAGLAQSLPD